MVFLSRSTTAAGRRECFWTFDRVRKTGVLACQGKQAVASVRLARLTTCGTHVCHDSRDGRLPLLRFQRDVAAAALAIDAQQNLFVSLQFLADADQILRVLDWLLIHFLDHVSLTQTSLSSRRVRINFCDRGALNVFWKIQRRANVVGDISYRDSTENSSFLRLRAFFGGRCGTFFGRARRHLSKLYIERFRLTFAIHLDLRLTARRHRSYHQTQLARIAYFLSVNCGNHIAGFHPRFFRGSLWRDLAH